MVSSIVSRLGKAPEEGIKAPCVVESGANLTLNGLQTINTVVLAENDRVLVKDQTDPRENGIYIASATSWKRASDFDQDNDLFNGIMVLSAFTRVVYSIAFTGFWDAGVTPVNFNNAMFDPLTGVVTIAGGQSIAGTTTLNDFSAGTGTITGTGTINDLDVTTNIDAETIGVVAPNLSTGFAVDITPGSVGNITTGGGLQVTGPSAGGSSVNGLIQASTNSPINSLYGISNDAAGVAIRAYSNVANRTVPLVDFVNDNATGTGNSTVLRVQQDQYPYALRVEVNHTQCVAGSFYSNTANRTTDLVSIINAGITGVGAALNITQSHAGFGAAVTSLNAASTGGYFTSAIASRTVPLVLIKNTNVTGSGVGLEIQQDQGGAAIDLTGQGTIKFPAIATPSADVNTLDDYEEGTFTPTIHDASESDAEGQTYTSQFGLYTKIGRVVYINLTITIASLGTLTGTDPAYIGGLPFTSRFGNPFYSFSIGYGNSLNIVAGEAVSAYVQGNRTRIDLNKWDLTTGSSFMTIDEVSPSSSFHISGFYLV